MSDPQSPEFDFDRLAALAAHAPEAFEAVRRRMITALIDGAPAGSKRRLEGLQWRIDMERSRQPSPLSACRAISCLMWDRVAGADGLIDQFAQLGAVGRGAPASSPAPDPAAVLVLRASAEAGEPN